MNRLKSLTRKPEKKKSTQERFFIECSSVSAQHSKTGGSSTRMRHHEWPTTTTTTTLLHILQVRSILAHTCTTRPVASPGSCFPTRAPSAPLRGCCCCSPHRRAAWGDGGDGGRRRRRRSSRGAVASNPKDPFRWTQRAHTCQRCTTEQRSRKQRKKKNSQCTRNKTFV